MQFIKVNSYVKGYSHVKALTIAFGVQGIGIFIKNHTTFLKFWLLHSMTIHSLLSGSTELTFVRLTCIAQCRCVLYSVHVCCRASKQIIFWQQFLNWKVKLVLKQCAIYFWIALFLVYDSVCLSNSMYRLKSWVKDKDCNYVKGFVKCWHFNLAGINASI